MVIKEARKCCTLIHRSRICSRFNCLSEGGVDTQQLLKELVLFKPKPFTLYIDNQSCIHLANNPKHHPKIKHVRHKFHFVRQLAEQGEVILEYTPTTNQWADFLTKTVPQAKHENCLRHLGLQDSRLSFREGGV